MILKGTEEVEVGITMCGQIALSQSNINNVQNTIYLTMTQFHIINKWYVDNENEISLAWNGGKVKDEDYCSEKDANGESHED